MAEFLTSSLFGELTKRVQIRFDKVSELNKQLYDNIIFEDYLDWDTPTIATEFSELIGQYGLTVMAPTIGENSKEAIIGHEGLQTMSERLLTHAITTPMTAQDYRKILTILDSKAISDAAKTKQLVDIMFKNVDYTVKAVLTKLDYIFLKTLFNEGTMTLDGDNNPEGGVRGTIDFNQPAENIASATLNWTDANIETVDCMEDIEAIIDAASDKVTFKEILCSPGRISYMRRSKKMKQMIWGTDKSSRLVSLADINAYMSQNGYPTFKAIRRQMVVQNGTARTTVNPVTEGNMVFVPAGKLGLVKNAYLNNELRPESGITYSNYGRVRVAQWGVGEKEGTNGVEFTKAEALALPAITEMQGIYTLKTLG